MTAMEPCELLVLDRPTFERMIADFPQLAIRLMVILSQRLRHTTSIHEDSVFLEVPARLAKFLLNFSFPAAGAPGEPGVFEFKMSQYEIGTLINASRESVNKLIRDWEGQGIIQRQSGQIQILDRDRLEDISGYLG